MGVLFLVMLPFILLLRKPLMKPPAQAPPSGTEQAWEDHQESQEQELILVD